MDNPFTRLFPRRDEFADYPRVPVKETSIDERATLLTLIDQYWAHKQWEEVEQKRASMGVFPRDNPIPPVEMWAILKLRFRLFGYPGYESLTALADPLLREADKALIDRGVVASAYPNLNKVHHLSTRTIAPWHTRINLTEEMQHVIMDLPLERDPIPDIPFLMTAEETQETSEALGFAEEPPDLVDGTVSRLRLRLLKHQGKLPPPHVFHAFQEDEELKLLAEQTISTGLAHAFWSTDHSPEDTAQAEILLRLVRSGDVNGAKRFLRDYLGISTPSPPSRTSAFESMWPVPPSWSHSEGMRSVPSYVRDLPGPPPVVVGGFPGGQSGEYDPRTNQVSLTDPKPSVWDDMSINLRGDWSVLPPRFQRTPGGVSVAASAIPLHEYAHKVDYKTGTLWAKHGDTGEVVSIHPAGQRSGGQLLEQLFRRYCDHFGPYACQNPTEFFAEVMTAYWSSLARGRDALSEFRGLHPDLYEYARNIDNDLRRKAGHPERPRAPLPLPPRRQTDRRSFAMKLSEPKTSPPPPTPAVRRYPHPHRTVRDMLDIYDLHPPEESIREWERPKMVWEYDQDPAPPDMQDLDELVGSDVELNVPDSMRPPEVLGYQPLKDPITAGYRAAIRNALNAGDMNKAMQLNDEWYKFTGM